MLLHILSETRRRRCAVRCFLSHRIIVYIDEHNNPCILHTCPKNDAKFCTKNPAFSFFYAGDTKYLAHPFIYLVNLHVLLRKNSSRISSFFAGKAGSKFHNKQQAERFTSAVKRSAYFSAIAEARARYLVIRARYYGDRAAFIKMRSIFRQNRADISNRCAT